MDKTDLIWIKPKEGLGIREPKSRLFIAPEGMAVVAGDPHWAQLIRFGDVEVTEWPAEPEQTEEHAA